jgi:hypothetical protein
MCSTLGDEMGKPHILGSAADAPWIKFPDTFCLGPLKNGTCGTPAGVSAVVYDSNPMVCIVYWQYKSTFIVTLVTLCTIHFAIF